MWAGALIRMDDGRMFGKIKDGVQKGRGAWKATSGPSRSNETGHYSHRRGRAEVYGRVEEGRR